jgi:hypothetical protein
MTIALATMEETDTELFLESDLTPQEWTERQADELAIKMAGKDRLEKALIIGERLSRIYNAGTFRRAAPGGERWTWADWVAKLLPGLLPDEAPKLDGADRRRVLWEARKLLSPEASRPAAEGVPLPTSTKHGEGLGALIPRKITNIGGWAPAILDDPDRAEGLRLVWALALKNAATEQRKNGPTEADVKAAREELRPQLLKLGLIREAPAGFQAAAAARVEASRQRTVDVTPPKPADTAAFRDTMAGIRATAPERKAKVEARGVRDELSKSEREHRHLLDEEVRHYNRRLHDASKSIHELHSYLQNLSRIHGTELLDEMRCVDVMGLITVSDDMVRLQEMGKELMEAVKLARSSSPSTGINMTTLDA